MSTLSQRSGLQTVKREQWKQQRREKKPSKKTADIDNNALAVCITLKMFMQKPHDKKTLTLTACSVCHNMMITKANKHLHTNDRRQTNWIENNCVFENYHKLCLLIEKRWAGKMSKTKWEWAEHAWSTQILQLKYILSDKSCIILKRPIDVCFRRFFRLWTRRYTSYNYREYCVRFWSCLNVLTTLSF